ncbi:glutamate--cysteine ligase-like isoform X2 [Limulus polyphemus]|uniref:Glutamate--cysteine ligase n=1 Tax=Limulus polyphemus TaxID=6850 RepID=A0ABM1SQX0_LIMPO|nr:glutamate--cysteine ligase-like isoform X2 [Limulus polyphemus]
MWMKYETVLSNNSYTNISNIKIERTTLLNGEMSESAGEWSEEATESMVESSPRGPFGDVFKSCLLVEENMLARRKEVLQVLNPDETYLTISVFPRFGQKDFTEPFFKPTPDKGIFMSLFVADEVLCSQNELYRSMTINAEEQRGQKLLLNVPIFQDTKTPKPFLEKFVGADDDGQSEEGALPDCIFGDCCLFGLSFCALQVTVQAPNLEDAKYLYDHLTVLSPIMMALTAAVPIFRGYLTDRDCRFQILSDAVDTRTKMEKEKPDQLGYTVIPCSRWEPVSFYLSTDHSKLNDVPIVYDEKYFDKLVNSGVDPQLARLISRSFARDPLFVSEKQLEEDETGTFNLLVVLLSTTFPTIRLKIPDAANSAFWRLEFRPMEVQFTDYENAAFSIFVVILAKIILEKKLSLLIPISKVLENVERAQKRDAVRNEKFWMKSNFQDDDSGWEELTVNEVINGKDSDHVGLVSVIRQYISENV